jgi:hypothetical protein
MIICHLKLIFLLVLTLSYRASQKTSHGVQHRLKQKSAKKAWETIKANKAKAALQKEMAYKEHCSYGLDKPKLYVPVPPKTTPVVLGSSVSAEEAYNIAKETTEAFYTDITRPVENAALWYTYYYLGNVIEEGAGADQLHPMLKNRFKHQFDNLSKRLSTAFMNYGIYATLRELRHARGQSSVKLGESKLEKFDKWAKENNITYYSDSGWAYRLTDKYSPGASVGSIASGIGNRTGFLSFCDNFTRMKPDEAALLWVFCANSWEPGKSKTAAVEYLTGVRREGLDFTDKHYFDMAENIFKNLNWNHAFGGNAWANICKALKRRDEESSTLWIDTMWSIQHNGGTWINKVDIPYDAEKQQSFGGRYENIYASLKKVLDANFREDIKPVGKLAARFEPTLEIYLDKLPAHQEKGGNI